MKTCDDQIVLLSTLELPMVSYRLENLTFFFGPGYCSGYPRSFADHASLCSTPSSIKLCPKTVKILAVKGLSLGNLFYYTFLSNIQMKVSIKIITSYHMILSPINKKYNKL